MKEAIWNTNNEKNIQIFMYSFTDSKKTTNKSKLTRGNLRTDLLSQNSIKK